MPSLKSSREFSEIVMSLMIEQKPVTAKKDLESTQRQRILLLAMCSSPILVVLLGLYLLHDALFTVLIFHAVLILSGLSFCRYNENCRRFDYMEGEWNNMRKQWEWGLGLFTGSVLVLAVPLVLAVLYFNNIVKIVIGIYSTDCGVFHLDCDYTWTVFFFAFYFAIVNPLIEELFWRIFILKSLPNTAFYISSSSVLFGLYHGFVVYAMTGILQTLVTFLAMSALGFGLVIIKKKLGFITACLAHASLDVTLMIGMVTYLS
jgi:membrane protease YdiL (CAAX protease family)